MKFPHSIVFSMLIMSMSSLAEIAIIVHPSNTDDFNTENIARIFTGKQKVFPSGADAVPIVLTESHSATGEFNEKVLNRSASQVKAYWSKLVFTGKGTPPKDVNSEQEMLSLVKANPNIIGYVPVDKVDDSVKVVGKF